jgi:hypothetical protein
LGSKTTWSFGTLSQDENNQAAKAKEAVVTTFLHPDDLFVSLSRFPVFSGDALRDVISKKVMK